MINRYEIRKVNNQEVLYIFIDNSYEFAKINNKEKIKDFNKMIQDFIKENKIKFTGTTIAIVVGGLIINNIYLNNMTLNYNANLEKSINDEYYYTTTNRKNNNIKDTNSIEEVETEDNTNETQTNTNKEITKITESNSSITDSTTNTNENINTEINNTKEFEEAVTVFRTNGEVLTLELEEYLINVVAAEMPSSFNIEALKSQSILARTYAKKAIASGKTLTDSISTQAYLDNSQLRALWGNSYETYYNKIKVAVEATKGQVLTYNNQYIEAVYHSTSNGYTESSYNVWGNYYPYLISVESNVDKNVTNYEVTTYFSYLKLSNLLGYTVNSDTEFTILERNESCRVSNVSINGNTYSGIQLRTLLGIRSADFDFEIIPDGINITTRGYGHGVGMSQYGANELAKNGYSYKYILSYYYPGTSLR